MSPVFLEGALYWLLGISVSLIVTIYSLVVGSLKKDINNISKKLEETLKQFDRYDLEIRQTNRALDDLRIAIIKLEASKYERPYIS